MRAAVVLAILLGLAACGVDGAPKPPAAKSGFSVTGDVAVGVSGQL
jgi:predicted small lipoprotein YifL